MFIAALIYCYYCFKISYTWGDVVIKMQGDIKSCLSGIIKRNVLLFGLVMFKKCMVYHYWTNFSYSVFILRTTTEKMFDRWSTVFIHTAVMSWSMYYSYRNRTKCVYVHDRSRWTNWRNATQERHIGGVDTLYTRIWIHELYIFKFWPVANIRCGRFSL